MVRAVAIRGALIRQGAKAYFVAAVVAQGCSLVRYTIMARLLGPEQLGMAAILILTAQFFESISDSGSDRFLIQDDKGDDPAVQKLVQLVFVARGVLIALALLVAAIPVAHLYAEPSLAPALMVLAAAPLIAGFLHLDCRRLQRQNEFRPEALALAAAEVCSLVVTVLAAYFTRDFSAILYGLITRSVVFVSVSHLTSKRRYALGYSASDAGRLALFAAPLLLNGILLFLGSQGDRVLIGHQLGLTDLGYYTAVLLLVSSPAAMLQRYLGATHLPLISRARNVPADLERAAGRLGGQTLLLAFAMAAGFALVGGVAVSGLYGPAFHQPAIVIALVGALQAARFIRLWPTNVALGMGLSHIVLANNVARLIAFPAAIVGFVVVGGLPGILGGFILGELLALTVAVVMRNQRANLPLGYDFDRVLSFVATVVTIVGISLAVEHRQLIATGLLVAVLGGLAGWMLLREKAIIVEAGQLLRRARGLRR